MSASFSNGSLGRLSSLLPFSSGPCRVAWRGDDVLVREGRLAVPFGYCGGTVVLFARAKLSGTFVRGVGDLVCYREIRVRLLMRLFYAQCSLQTFCFIAGLLRLPVHAGRYRFVL